MKKLIIAVSASALVLGASYPQAFAADLPSRQAPPVFVPPVVSETWTGCYGGAFGALDVAHIRDNQVESRTFRNANATTTTNTLAPIVTPVAPLPGQIARFRVQTPTVRTTTTTVTNASAQPNQSFGRTSIGGDGGGRIGCNYQMAQVVFGAQLEGGYLGIDGSSANPLRTTSITRVTGGPYGALSGRIGYAIAPRTLLFVRGGVGYADLRYATLDNTLGYFGGSRGSQVMPLVGAGIEYKLTPQISLTGEYTYLRPGCRTINYTIPSSTRVIGGLPTDINGNGSTSSCVDKHMIALGVNYYFTPAAPVVARY